MWCAYVGAFPSVVAQIGIGTITVAGIICTCEIVGDQLIMLFFNHVLHHLELYQHPSLPGVARSASAEYQF